MTPRTTRRSLLSCALALAGAVGCRRDHGPKKKKEATAPSAPRVPGKKWERTTPPEAGLDPAPLAELASWLQGDGCVVRGGRIVHEWGRISHRVCQWSASKPVFAHLLAVAVAEGRIPSLDAPVLEWEPRLGDLNAALGHKDRQITFRHMITQTSCYGVRETPGTAFDYSDYQMTLLWETLCLRVFGATVGDVSQSVLQARLTSALGCENGPTFSTPDQPSFGLVSLSAQDFARFGLLYLRGGQWGGKQIIPQAMVRELTGTPLPLTLPRTRGEEAEMLPAQRTFGAGKNQEAHLGCYSHAWWVNGTDGAGQHLWPEAPADAYAALGHGGRFALVVVPSLDLVAAWNAQTIPFSQPMEGEGRVHTARALRLLCGAARSSA